MLGFEGVYIYSEAFLFQKCKTQTTLVQPVAQKYTYQGSVGEKYTSHHRRDEGKHSCTTRISFFVSVRAKLSENFCLFLQPVLFFAEHHHHHHHQMKGLRGVHHRRHSIVLSRRLRIAGDSWSCAVRHRCHPFVFRLEAMRVARDEVFGVSHGGISPLLFAYIPGFAS